MFSAVRRRELIWMRAAFPALPAFDLSADDELDRVFPAYVALVPGLHPPALPAEERSALTLLVEKSADPKLKRLAARQIALSDISAGMVCSMCVRESPDLYESVQPDLLRYEAAYCAPVFTRKWQSYSRGHALAYYFANIEHELEGRKVLHIAPETEVSRWLRPAAQRSALSTRRSTSATMSISSRT